MGQGNARFLSGYIEYDDHEFMCIYGGLTNGAGSPAGFKLLNDMWQLDLSASAGWLCASLRIAFSTGLTSHHHAPLAF